MKDLEFREVDGVASLYRRQSVEKQERKNKIVRDIIESLILLALFAVACWGVYHTAIVPFQVNP